VCGFSTAVLAAVADCRPLTIEDLRPLAKQALCAPITLEVLATASGTPEIPGTPPQYHVT
jgi:protein-L-isoaspartate O-methyltransferase